MFVPTLIMAGIALVLVGIGYHRGQGQHIVGMKCGLRLTVEVLPLLLFAFIVAGMIQTLVSREALARWVGGQSGLSGILIGTVAGGLCPGGPYVSLPIVASLLKVGASTGVMVAFLTSWSLWAVSRIPMEVGILGWKFTLVRLASTFFFPPIAGLIAQKMTQG